MRRIVLVAAGLSLLLACSESRKPAKLSEVLPHIPLPPSSALLSREGGEDAVKLRFHSDLVPDELAKYYRTLLGKPPWKLVSDEKMADGSMTLYAEQQGPSLWVTIRKADSTQLGSFIELAGAKNP